MLTVDGGGGELASWGPLLEEIIQLSKAAIFRLGQEEVAEEPADDVPSSVPTKCARVAERLEHGKPAEADDEVEAPGDSSSTESGKSASDRGRGVPAGGTYLHMPISRIWRGKASAE